MSPQMVILGDVAEADSVELTCVAATCSIDWEENGPGQKSSSQADVDDEFEESQVKVGVQ